MSNKLPPEEERFAANASVMADAIYSGIEKLHNDGYKVIDLSMVLMAKAVIESFDRVKLINGFIEKSHKECWDKIKERNEEHFVKNASIIFSFLPTDNVSLFTDLFLTKDKNDKSVIPEELKIQIWKLFDAMIRVSIRYIHKHRASNPEFFGDVKLKHHIKTWNLDL